MKSLRTLLRILALATGLLLPHSRSAGAESSVATPSRPDPQPGTPPIQSEEVERLRALGYAGFDSGPAGQHADGVTVHDGSRSAPGYNLYTNPRTCEAVLIDANGRVVNRWSAVPCGRWYHATLLESGDLLVPGTDSKAGDEEEDLPQRYLLSMSWSGEIRWRRRLPVHHDVEVAGSDGLIGLLASNRPEPSPDGATTLRDNSVARFTREGVVGDHYSLLVLMAPRKRGIPVKSVVSVERDSMHRSTSVLRS